MNTPSPISFILRKEANLQMTTDDLSIFKDHLQSGEKILWHGKPETSKIFAAGDMIWVPLSIIIIAFYIFAVYEIKIKHVPIHNWPSNLDTIYFLLLLFLPAFYYVFGRFIFKALDKKDTWYAVTNKKIIIKRNFIYSRPQTADIKEAGSMTKYIDSDGIGTIVFGDESFTWRMFRNTGLRYPRRWWREKPKFLDQIALYDIKNADMVYKILVKIQKPDIDELKRYIDEEKN